MREGYGLYHWRMHFSLVDRILVQEPGRVVTLKNVSNAEEYLQDHFPTFPVLPGVMMLEAMVQASRILCEAAVGPSAAALPPFVLGRARALKYGALVKPGSSLRVEVTLGKAENGSEFDIKGEARLIDPAKGHSLSTPLEELPVAVSGRLTMRPARAESAPNAL